MPLADLIDSHSVVGVLRPTSKKQLLQLMAERAAERTGMDGRGIFDALLAREKLGSTGVGHGVAIPHAKLSKLTGIVGLFARLERPIEYEALDDEPIDLVFLLLAPEQAGAEHLKALARVSRILRDKATASRLRGTFDPDALFSILHSQSQQSAA
jgi:nitrogen PTS system EIIA component